MIAHQAISANDVTVDFYCGSDRCVRLYTDVCRARWEGPLSQMPRTHLRVLAPIMLVERKPRGGDRSGGWFPPSDARFNVATWRNAESNTGVSNEELDQVLATRPGRGLIAVTRHAMEQTIRHLTLMHEVGHCVDLHLHIVTPATPLSDFAGQRYPAADVKEYAAEAYARAMCCLVPRICRPENRPASETQYQCGMRTIRTLRRTPAFAGCTEWGPVRR